MTSNYYKIKTRMKDFSEYITSLIEKNKDKKVVLYSIDDNFLDLDKKFSICSKLNIIGVLSSNKDIFEENNYTAILPEDIGCIDYDVILIANEKTKKSKEYLIYTLDILPQKIIPVFNEDIKDELSNIEDLCRNDIEKHILNLSKKLKDKKIVIYSVGNYFETINKYFDLSQLNIIGVSDLKFTDSICNTTYCGYKVIKPEDIVKYNPDYILIAKRYYISLMEDFHFELFKNTNIKCIPLINKNIFQLIAEFVGY